MILYQDCSSHWDSSKNMAARGRGLFSLYIYIENFKSLLVKNQRTDFNRILQKCFCGNPLPRLFKPFGFIKKHGRQGAGLIFLYIYIEKFENLLFRNHWTNFNIILQKRSFGDPLPRLLMPFGFVKKRCRQGAGFIFPIYLQKTLKIFLSETNRFDFNIILQKCFFGDPLPRLFKPFGFVKKHGRQWGAGWGGGGEGARGGLIFPINLYRKL